MTELPLPQLIARIDGERLQRYRAHLDFYHGRQWAGTPRRRERRLTFNYARAVVDKTTAYQKQLHLHRARGGGGVAEGSSAGLLRPRLCPRRHADIRAMVINRRWG